MDIQDLKDGIVYVSFTSREGSDYAYLYVLLNRTLYWVDENNNEASPMSQASFDDYANEIDNYEEWDSLDSFGTLDDFLEAVGNAKKESVEGDCECEGDWSYASENDEYLVTLFVGDEKVMEKIVS